MPRLSSFIKKYALSREFESDFCQELLTKLLQRQLGRKFFVLIRVTSSKAVDAPYSYPEHLTPNLKFVQVGDLSKATKDTIGVSISVPFYVRARNCVIFQSTTTRIHRAVGLHAFRYLTREEKRVVLAAKRLIKKDLGSDPVKKLAKEYDLPDWVVRWYLWKADEVFADAFSKSLGGPTRFEYETDYFDQYVDWIKRTLL